MKAGVAFFACAIVCTRAHAQTEVGAPPNFNGVWLAAPGSIVGTEAGEMAAGGGRIGPAQWALVHLAAGNIDQALDWLNTAAENRLPVGGFFITALKKANLFSDPILDQPEFVEVRSRLGFRE